MPNYKRTCGRQSELFMSNRIEFQRNKNDLIQVLIEKKHRITSDVYKNARDFLWTFDSCKALISAAFEALSYMQLSSHTNFNANQITLAGWQRDNSLPVYKSSFIPFFKFSVYVVCFFFFRKLSMRCSKQRCCCCFLSAKPQTHSGNTTLWH